jgi:outer membrane protein assembly factor BamD
MVGCGSQPQLSANQNTTKSPSRSTASIDDDNYVSFRDSHENSPKIPQMIISLIKSHTTAGEYQLAEFYCNEYRRDFPSGRKRDEVEYLSIKALYLNNKKHFDERFSKQIKIQAKMFFANFRHSKYKPKIQSILTNIKKEQNARYEELAKEYEAKGKPKAAEFYREKIRKL